MLLNIAIAVTFFILGSWCVWYRNVRLMAKIRKHTMDSMTAWQKEILTRYEQASKPAGKYDHIPLPDDTWIRCNGEERIPVAEDDDFSVIYNDGEISKRKSSCLTRRYSSLWTWGDGDYNIIAYKIHGKLKKEKPSDYDFEMATQHAEDANKLCTAENKARFKDVQKPKAMTAAIKKKEALPKIPRGYKRHDGGECPLPAGTKVSVICRDKSKWSFEISKAWDIGKPNLWIHDGVAEQFDIKFYRVLSYPIKPKKTVKRAKTRKVS